MKASAQIGRILFGIVVVAGITAAVSQGTTTPAIIKALGDAFNGSLRAATGRG